MYHPEVCVFTVLRGALRRGRSRLVSNRALQHLHVGLELIEQTPGPALSGLGGLAVVHPVGTTVTWRGGREEEEDWCR